MGKVTAGATVSLDGYIAGPDETGFEHLFAWFDGGDLEFPFVTDGLASAIEQARAIAGDRNVVVTPGKITSQCLELGLLDEVSIDLVPVLLGSGVPFVDQLKAAPILLDGPSLVVEGERVTHLRYTIRRP